MICSKAQAENRGASCGNINQGVCEWQDALVQLSKGGTKIEFERKTQFGLSAAFQSSLSHLTSGKQDSIPREGRIYGPRPSRKRSMMIRRRPPTTHTSLMQHSSLLPLKLHPGPSANTPTPVLYWKMQNPSDPLQRNKGYTSVKDTQHVVK